MGSTRLYGFVRACVRALGCNYCTLECGSHPGDSGVLRLPGRGLRPAVAGEDLQEGPGGRAPGARGARGDGAPASQTHRPRVRPDPATSSSQCVFSEVVCDLYKDEW